MNTKINQTNDLPDRDKYLLRPYQDKKQFIDEFPRMMSERNTEYDMYFLTFTFSGFKSNIAYTHYHDYFRYFRQRLDNALLSNAKAYHKRPFLFLFPEATPQIHFHGILFIHKLTSQKFQRKCVLDIEREYNNKLDKNVSSIHLKPQFINPYPKAANCQHAQAKIIRSKRSRDRSAYQKQILYTEKPILKVADYKIHPIVSPEEQIRSFSYSVKHFIPSHFTLDDLIVEAKEQPSEKYK